MFSESHNDRCRRIGDREAADRLSPQGSRQPPLEFFFQEQSYSSLHSGWSLAWDHIRGDIDDSCGAIADFCGVVADPGGAFAIGGRRCGDGVRCATR